MTFTKKFLPLILILLLAFVLRSYSLTEIPPGLTHDEANHGRDSINILNGVLLFYFPLNYGSEPLYNYAVAASMALIGENLFALRYVNVLFGILTIAASYLWVNWAYGRPTAMIGAALLAISFWPVVTSRQALRAGMLPFLITASVVFFWLIFRWAKSKRREGSFPWRYQWWVVAGFALSVTLTLHTYLAARILWLIYPIFLGYLAILHRVIFRRIWKPVTVGLLVAGLLIIPMFLYLEAHPEADTRLEMLDGPLQNLSQGNLLPIINNIVEGFMAFFWKGFGDHFLAYNIPGRPVLEIITAIFFIVGLLTALWKFRRPAYAFLLIWFIIGILPSLITGPEANTTRNLGALPPTFILPAIGFVTTSRLVMNRWGRVGKRVAAGALIAWLALVLISTTNDYFMRWAQSPDIRAAYQHTLTQALEYIAKYPQSEPVVISSIYPGPAHDPSIAKVLLDDGDYDLRWVDSRQALIFPDGSSAKLIVPASTPIHPFFQDMVMASQQVTLRPDDLDPYFTISRLEKSGWTQTGPAVNFGDAVTLLSARWLDNTYFPGDMAELLTVWQVNDPVKVGPLVPPAFETNASMFTHVLDDSGSIIAQRDSLEAPSWDWRTGDIIYQIHPVQIPNDLITGQYDTIVGIYNPVSGNRLSVIDDSGVIVGDHANVVPLRLNEQ